MVGQSQLCLKLKSYVDDWSSGEKLLCLGSSTIDEQSMQLICIRYRCYFIVCLKYIIKVNQWKITIIIPQSTPNTPITLNSVSPRVPKNMRSMSQPTNSSHLLPSLIIHSCQHISPLITLKRFRMKCQGWDKLWIVKCLEDSFRKWISKNRSPANSMISFANRKLAN